MILPSRLFLNNAHQKVCRTLFSYRLQLTFIPGEIEFGSPVIGKEGSQVSPAHLITPPQAAHILPDPRPRATFDLWCCPLG